VHTKYVVKIRPYVRKFLQDVSAYYEIYVYTFGSRSYALSVLNSIDPQETYLKKSRLMSRDDQVAGVKDLERILPKSHRHMALIIDDNLSVWKNYLPNLIQVKPYWFWNDERETFKGNIKVVGKSDVYLWFLIPFLVRANKIFFKSRAGQGESSKPDIRSIIKRMESLMFHGRTFGFTNVWPKSTDRTKTAEYRVVTTRGATIADEVEQLTHMFSYEFAATPKMKKAKNLKANLVHMKWIEYSSLYMAPLNPASFDLLKPELDTEYYSDASRIEENIVKHNTTDSIVEETSIADCHLVEYLLSQKTASN
jgi:hypothetical protein